MEKIHYKNHPNTYHATMNICAVMSLPSKHGVSMGVGGNLSGGGGRFNGILQKVTGEKYNLK